MQSLHAGLKAVAIENEFWRLVIVPERNGKVVEMTYKPTRRDVVRARRGFNRFRFEDWFKQGDGPKSDNILAFTAEAEPQRVRLKLTMKDGTELERSITLAGGAVRFETRVTADAPRPFEVLVHPEYDTESMSADPDVMSIYVKQPDWIQANRNETAALRTAKYRFLAKDAVSGGAYAFFNHRAKFGVLQQFDPSLFSGLGLFWDPSRQQINLEMTSKVVSLEKGQTAGYAYEVRYLEKPPRSKK
jgi:hypothetical protein